MAASQVGMVAELDDTGIVPDILVGVSAGAINAAFLAAHPGRQGLVELETLWRGLRGTEVFPGGALAQVVRVIRGGASLFPNDGLRTLLDSAFGAARLEQCDRRAGIVATRMPSGLPRLFTQGSLVETLLASTAIPGVFPPVVLDGNPYIDGGVVTNVPLVAAELLEAQSYVVLDAGPPCAAHGETSESLLSTLTAAISIATRQRIATELPRIAARHRVVYIAAPCSTGVLPNDFSGTAALIDAGRGAASHALALGWTDGPGYTGEPHYHDHPELSMSWGLPRPH